MRNEKKLSLLRFNFLRENSLEAKKSLSFLSQVFISREKKVEGDLNARTRESPLEPGTVKPQVLLLLQPVLNLEWVEEVLQGLVGLK